MRINNQIYLLQAISSACVAGEAHSGCHSDKGVDRGVGSAWYLTLLVSSLVKDILVEANLFGPIQVAPSTMEKRT